MKSPRPISSPRSRRTSRAARAGFTLLEMLLTAILSAVLLAGLWSLFNTYMRLFETGQAKTEQSQLVRALAQQLADDLRSAILFPPADAARNSGSASSGSSVSGTSTSGEGSLGGGTTGSSGSGGSSSLSSSTTAGGAPRGGSLLASSSSPALPRLGLEGSARVLKLEVLQALPSATTGALFANDELQTAANQPAPVPELRTILYSFEEPREERATDRKAPPGLVRVELGWQEMLGRSGSERSSRRSSAPAEGEAALDEALERFGLTTPEGLASLPDEAKIHVPEVIRCEFRYFDGRMWHDAWSSRQRQALPAAVEITLQLSPPPERWKPRPAEPADGSAATAGREPTAPLPEGEALPVEIHRPVFRQVIALGLGSREAERSDDSFAPLDRASSGPPELGTTAPLAGVAGGSAP